MRGLTIKVLLFLLPVMVVFVLLEIALRAMPNDYKVKSAYLEEHAEEIEVLILGSSHAYYGIDPEYFSDPCFNAAFYSQTLRYDLEIVKKYQSRFEHLNTIILPISYFSLFSQLETGNAPYMVKKYNLYMGMDVSPALKDHMELLGIQLRKNLRKLGDYYLRGEDPITCTELGWGTTHNSIDNQDLEKTGASASLRHTLLIENAAGEQEKENLESLRQLTGICHEKGIHLLLVTLPAYETYAQRLKSEHLDYMQEALNTLIDGNANLLYLDLLNDPAFAREDFYDADHMNEKGTQKLSLILNEALATLF